MRDVLRFARGVHHDVQVAPRVENHQIIKDTACVVGEERVTLLTRCDTNHVNGNESFERRSRVGAMQLNLPHVRHIKQTSMRSSVQVLFQHAEGILHWHFVAGKRHHARAKAHMQVVQRGAGKGFWGGLRHIGTWLH